MPAGRLRLPAEPAECRSTVFLLGSGRHLKVPFRERLSSSVVTFGHGGSPGRRRAQPALQIRYGRIFVSHGGDLEQGISGHGGPGYNSGTGVPARHSGVRARRPGLQSWDGRPCPSSSGGYGPPCGTGETPVPPERRRALPLHLERCGSFSSPHPTRIRHRIYAIKYKGPGLALVIRSRRA
jgi:hypothetical protein